MRKGFNRSLNIDTLIKKQILAFKNKKIIKIAVLLFSFVLLFSACSRSAEEKIAVIWTDRVDFVSYCEVFNNLQSEYKVVVEYRENPAEAVINAKEQPDIVISSWLKGKAARAKFDDISHLLSDDRIRKSSFYPELLNLGNINGQQYFLPISFNLPIIIFASKNNDLIKNDFTLSLDEIKEACQSFNKLKKSSYSKMGFSPLWSDDFLYMTAKGFNAAFVEGDKFFSWNDPELRRAIEYVRNWSTTVNTSPKHEEEFKFKYLYDLPHVFIKNDRCLFYYVSSEELFSIPQEKLEDIDFRWLSFDGKTPLKDDILYAGICNESKNQKAAEAFFEWIFNEGVQKQLLERSNEMDLMVSSFGFAGGFSALREVTEKLLPKYYPLLLAHLPQTKNVYIPRVLPSNWLSLKNDLLIPYLKDSCNLEKNPNSIPSFNKHITEWYKNK